MQAVGRGADFPTVWQTVLKGHRLVAGIPRQRLAGVRALLEVPLITGHCVVYDGEAKVYSLEMVT
jgi:hypothetical protein